MSDTGRPGQFDPRPEPTGPAHRPAATPQGVPGPATGGWAGDPSGARASGPAPVFSGPDDATPPPAGGRPAWLLPAAIGVGVLVVVGVVAGVLATRGGDADADAPTPAASTVVAPLPTPAVQPAARPATTAFASALPTTVLQYALESSQEDAERLGAGALEAYSETFTDGDGGTVVVRAAQLETPQDASAMLAAVTATLPAVSPDTGAPASTASADVDVELPQSGEVTVDGAAVGTFSVVDAGDGTGVAVWQNGTAVFQLTAPLADVVDVYRAYGL